MKTELHNCTQCHSGAGEIDCTSCKLAQLGLDKPRLNYNTKMAALEQEDDYSISGELTAKDNSLSIFYLVIAAAATLGFVVLFTWIFR